MNFQAVKRRKVEATFSGGEISSDGGVVLLREADRHLGLLEAASRVLHDPRDSGKVVHSQLSLLRQRVYGLCLGYEDLNDHQELRRDPAIQTAVERSEVLASARPPCAGWNTAWTARQRWPCTGCLSMANKFDPLSANKIGSSPDRVGSLASMSLT